MSGFKEAFLLILVTFTYVKSSSIEAIDSNFLESVLDADECHRQIMTIRENVLLGMQFADAGIRTPRGILTGNTVDLGNYHQCLAIDDQRDDMHIQGKYCSILVPIDQTFRLLRSGEQQEWSTFNPASLKLDKASIRTIEEYHIKRRQLKALLIGDFDDLEDYRSIPNNPLSGAVFRLGVCVPKPCTTEQAITSLLFNITAIGFNYTEQYCRLPDDKPWSGADTAAVTIFSLIGFVTLLSTCYDLCYRFILKKDIKNVNRIYQSCSVYTNGQRLMTFSSGPGNLNCMDGIRAISMIWVIVGHSYSTELFLTAPLSSLMWMFSEKALWLTVAPISVDTFFTLAGILLVYASAGKMNGKKLLKNLHWFYIGRLVRITPLLAVTVLLQASYLNHMTDGPFWQTVENNTNRCRMNWWSTLLNIQNFLHPRSMCVAHSWYVAIDIQLYILSPLVLFWVLGDRRRNSWLALVGAFLAVLVSSTIYNFNLNVPAGSVVPSRTVEQMLDYLAGYYFNTLSRASPFFVGLIIGYILHVYRGQKVQMSWIYGILLWACAATIAGCIVYFHYCIKQVDWDNQFINNVMNSIMRPSWALAVGIVIFNCEHGYGGPVNWFLSLSIWRLPARLSYGMYLFHYPLMFTINGTIVAPIYFTVGLFAFKSLSYLALSLAVSFFFTMLVDSPISTLFKQMTTTALRKQAVPAEENKGIELNNANNDEDKHKTNADDVGESKDNIPAITIK